MGVGVGVGVGVRVGEGIGDGDGNGLGVGVSAQLTSRIVSSKIKPTMTTDSHLVFILTSYL